MRKVFSLLITLFVASVAFGQAPLKPADLVEYQKSFNTRFTPISDLFSIQTTSVRNRPDVANEVSEAILLNFNGEMARQIGTSTPEAMTLSLPFDQNTNVEVELVKVNIFTPDFYISQAGPEKIDHELGTHYRGVIKGMEGSIAAVSIFKNEVVGLFSGPRIGNFVLGALKGDNANREHILYNDGNLVGTNGFSCEMPDDDFAGYTEDQLSSSPNTRALSDCVRIFMEVDYDIFQDKGSGTTAFVTAEFNEIATMYANESINYLLSEIKINNTSGSAYSNGSSSSLLSQFQSRTGSFNGDLGQLITYRSSGGVAAGFNGICNSNSDNSLCISDIFGNYQTVPTYSWDIDVQTHELGHLHGSRHTHACVWNGNNTAIDGCAGFTEGGCSIPGIPSGGGTVMSYCHVVSAGKDLSLGFGPQPGNVIRNVIANASCLQACDGGGGGGGCDDNEVTVTILTDNYPGETTWEVRNASGTVVGSGGPYGATGTTYTADLCLPDGCYDFTINDSYGDGICCAYGTGSYSVTSGSTTLASGGAFTSTETTNFCLGGGGGGDPCPAIDFNSYSVTAYGNGQDRGSSAIQDGGATLFLQNNAWKDISYNYTVTGSTVIEFDFRSTDQGEIQGIGFDDNESISSNRTFRVYGTQNWGIGNYDNYSPSAWTTYQIPVGTFYTGTFNRLFFVCDDDAGSSSNAYFRNVKIYEGSCSSSMPPSWLEQGAEPIAAQLGEDGEYQFDVYPSPLQNQMMTFLEAPQGEYAASISDLSGRVIWRGQILPQEQTHDVSGLPAGMYVLKVRLSDSETITRKVVKTN